MARRGFVMRWLARSGRALALATFFAFALVAGAALHTNLPLARAAIARHVSALLARVLAGRLRIETIGHLDRKGISGARVVIFDRSGRRVAMADGVGARLSYARLLRAAIYEHHLDIDIPPEISGSRSRAP